MGKKKAVTKYRANISVDRDLWVHLQNYAEEQHSTCSAIIQQWIVKYARVKDTQSQGQGK